MNTRTIKSTYSKSNSKEEEKILLQPYVHFEKQVDKSSQYLVRALRSFNHWTKIDEEKRSSVENVVTMTHQAILLFDTLRDEDIAKKNCSTVHSKLGIPSIINSASYVHFVALEKCFELQDPRVLTIFSSRTIEIYKSIFQEYEWSDSLRCPSEEEYLKMCSQKRGNVFKKNIEIMQLFSSNKSDFTEICNILGMFFTLYDDIVQLCSKTEWFGKIYFDRVSGRRYNFPIVHAFRAHSENMSLFKIFQQKSNNVELKNYFISSLKKMGCFEHTKNTLVRLKKEADEAIKKVGENFYLSNILEEMLQDVTKHNITY